jgi:hypothetical protein
MSEAVNRNRRRFLRNAAMTFAVAELTTIGSAAASNNTHRPSCPRSNRERTRHSAR